MTERKFRIAALDSSITGAIANLIFGLLVCINVTRTLRHAMWRDELQIFLLGLFSSSPWSLWLKLKYEGHPGLWYFIVWVITRFTSDPLWMQIAHITIAIGVWTIVYWWSPFTKLEKILLLLSYFLFWEYFVISRNYILLAIIAFAFIVLRERRPQQQVVLWLLLGLLANVHVFGTIWSMVLAAMLVIENRRDGQFPFKEVTIYLALLAFAIATLLPAADFGRSISVEFSTSRLTADLAIPFGAFVPFTPKVVLDALTFIWHPQTGPIPIFWNANPANVFIELTRSDIDHPTRLALALALPIAACWLVARQSLVVLEFCLVYLGIVLFSNFWDHPGVARHHGVVFLAFVVAAWTARLRRPHNASSALVLGMVLVVNAFGGVLTFASALRPISQGYNAASWIKQNGLAGGFLIGSRDSQTSTIAGYLGRQIYYLECECRGSYIVFNDKRKSYLSSSEWADRLTEAVALAESHDAILIRNGPVTEQDRANTTNVSITPLNSFTDPWTDESFWIYRVREKLAQ